jgi:hypothetical protein
VPYRKGGHCGVRNHSGVIFTLHLHFRLFGVLVAKNCLRTNFIKFYFILRIVKSLAKRVGFISVWLLLVGDRVRCMKLTHLLSIIKWDCGATVHLLFDWIKFNLRHAESLESFLFLDVSRSASYPWAILVGNFLNFEALNRDLVSNDPSFLVLLLSAVPEGALLHALLSLVYLIDCFCCGVIYSCRLGGFHDRVALFVDEAN